jgi:hypothetical protein
MALRRLGGRRRLHVVGEDDHAGRARGEGCAAGAVEQCRQLLGCRRHLGEFRRDVAHERREVDLLLIVGAERRALLLSHQGHHRLTVELGVVEAVQQVHRARPLRRQDDAQTARVLRVPHRHEGGGLLMARLHERGSAARAAQRPQHAVDAVSRVAEDARHAPVPQALDDHVGNRLLAHTPACPGSAHGKPACFTYCRASGAWPLG